MVFASSAGFTPAALAPTLLPGGRSLPPEQLGALIDELIAQSNALVETRESKRTLFDTGFLLLAFIVLLSAEWLLRKHWGLA